VKELLSNVPKDRKSDVEQLIERLTRLFPKINQIPMLLERATEAQDIVNACTMLESMIKYNKQLPDVAMTTILNKMQEFTAEPNVTRAFLQLLHSMLAHSSRYKQFHQKIVANVVAATKFWLPKGGVNCRYIRFTPTEVNNRMSMRVRVYGLWNSKTPGGPPYPIHLFASSFLDADSAPQKGLLYSRTAWTSADQNSGWLAVAFLQNEVVTHVGTQGKYRAGEWVKKYKLEYSMDAKSWFTAAEFNGNSDDDTPVYHSIVPDRDEIIKLACEIFLQTRDVENGKHNFFLTLTPI
jgi:hypothetical protein